MGEGSEAADVRYFVIPDAAKPYLLARVRWPDVAQAVSAARPDWQEDPGLFDLPYDPIASAVTVAQAASIAAGWGAHLRFDSSNTAPPLIRRMPANWSNMAPAERRAWSLEPIIGRRGVGPRRGRSRVLLRTLSPSQTRALEPAERMTNVLDEPAHDAVPQDAANLVGEDSSHLTTKAPERRRHARVHVFGRAHMSRGRETISGSLVNVSQGGVHCVVPQLALEFGGRLDPPLLLDDDISKSRITLEVSSSVTWLRENGPSTQLGVVFAEMDYEQVQRVQRFLVAAGAGAGS